MGMRLLGRERRWWWWVDLLDFIYNLYVRIFHTICVCQSIARPHLYFLIFLIKLDCPVPRYRRGWGVFLGM